MRKLLVVLALCWVTLGPAGAALAEVQAPAPISRAQIDPSYPLWIGAGALAGALAFNLLVIGPASLPILPGTVAAGAQVTPYAAMALARVYAGTSAVVGALLADRWYTTRP